MKTANKFSQNGVDMIKIVFPFDFSTLDKVKTLNGRKWWPEHKMWSAPVCVENVQSLHEWGFTLDIPLQQYLKKLQPLTQKSVEDFIPPVQIPGLKLPLRPFQQIGVAWAELLGGRVLIADDMGLGKTVQALGYLQLHRELRPALISVPSAVKYNWMVEAEKFLPDPRVEVISGRKPYPVHGDIIIFNYDIAEAWVDYFKSIKPQVFILDEIQYIKSRSAKRTKAINQIGKSIPHIIGLSGTPIENRPAEIFNGIKLINPMLFPNWFQFGLRYCNGKHGAYGWDFSGHSNEKELHQKLIKSVMIRRMKAEVLKDLPDKTYSLIPVEVDNFKEYRQAERDFIAYLQKTKGDIAAQRASRASTLAEIEGLKQLAVRGKLQEAIAWIQDFVDSGNKLVVFAAHQFVLDELMKVFGSIAYKIDGSVPAIKRQEMVEQFQTKPNKLLFFLNIKAGGVGLTLTAASNVAFLEYMWNPKIMEQAEDRCHRIGQKNAVTIYKFIAMRTIEETINKLLSAKNQTINKVMDGVDTPDDSLLDQLINEFALKE